MPQQALLQQSAWRLASKRQEYLLFNISDPVQLQSDGENIKQVSNFCYLGFVVAESTQDIRRRKGLAWSAFWKLENLWRRVTVQLETKLKFFQTKQPVCQSCYTAVSPGYNQSSKLSINAFATSCYRVMLGIKRIDTVTNAEVYRKIKAHPLVCTVLKRQLTSIGHLLRTDPCKPAHRSALYHPPDGGRQNTNYPKYIQERLGDTLGMLTPSQITNLAMERTLWCTVVVDCSAAEGWRWWPY